MSKYIENIVHMLSVLVLITTQIILNNEWIFYKDSISCISISL